MTIDIQVAAEAAVEAADVAEALIQQFLASGDWQVSEKPDNTPVTEVDVAVEKLIRERLTTALPVADFYGEETPGPSPGPSLESKQVVRWEADGWLTR